MRWTIGLSLGGVATIVVACGGSVSLGDTGSGLAGADAGVDGGADCSAKGACGPALGAPAIVCSDGSSGGNTGRCVKAATGACGWETRTCPPAPAPVCFDAAGDLDPSLKACAKTSDCVVVGYARDCCGNTHAAGVSATSAAAVKQCAADRAAAFATLPACGCPIGPTVADDGSTDPGGGTADVFCNASGRCESSYKTTACGTSTCTAAQTCCGGVPFPQPTCWDGTTCPISQRKAKKDITYLSEGDTQRLSDELLGFPIATYRYKLESAEERPHLGFIIDDVAPSPAVMASGERVDLYGYCTMTVATLQTQARELAELRRQVTELRRALGEVATLAGAGAGATRATPRSDGE